MAAPGPAWLRTAVFYQIYPQSFYDGNGDGIGDLPGLIRKLDYVRALGCTAIWINPCFVSPFQDAGYDVADYYRVAPRYGTNADLRRLFREARRRGIRVCLDLVPGHTSVEHPWFRASGRHRLNRYSNWYIWTDHWCRGPGIGGYAERNGQYLANFFYFQPALNYGFARPDPANPWQLPVDHPDVRRVRRELKKIIAFWLDQGASGFRVDMAGSLVKNDPDRRATSALWREIRGWLEARYPEAVLISEWGDPDASLPAGFHIDFLMHGKPHYTSLFRNEAGRDVYPMDHGFSFFDRRGRGDIRVFLDAYLTMLARSRRRGYIAIPSGNHDLPRISIGRSEAELKVAFTFLLTMPGVPFIYYGDEIGMRYRRDLPSKEGGYNRTGSRTPMQWDDSRNAGFSRAPAARLYLPVDPDRRRPTVARQLSYPDSLLNHVRRLIALRRACPALQADGDFQCLYGRACRYPLVYLRRQGRERIVVAVNPGRFPVTADFAVPGPAGRVQPLIPAEMTVQVIGQKHRVTMPGVSYGVYRL